MTSNKKDLYHPATHGGHHFIFSPENPKAKPRVSLKPEEVLSLLRSWGETVEDTHGKYGSIERSFIVHDPKNVDKLHNLASNLGQESAIYSGDSIHEMHYYHGVHAGKVRSGQGTQVFSEKPDDNYTKITDHEHQASFFSHNFDFDDKNLKSKINKNEELSDIMEALGKSETERFKFKKYWGLMLEGLTDNHLEKALKVRTEKRVFVAMDGDNIGASVQRAAMADDLDTIIQQSQTISEGQKLIREWAVKKNADIYIDGGDDIAFTLPVSEIKELDQLRRAYGERTGFTITIGVGDSISRAGHAMLYGKLKGKNQVNEWRPEIDKELERISRDLTPEEKMADHGLLGKDEGFDLLEKAVPPPKKPGEVSPDGRYVSKHHKGAGMQAWHYNPQLSSEYDNFIDSNKKAFIEKHPPEHQKVLSDFIDSVRGDSNRHFVISRDKRDGGDKIRARHVRGLLQGDENYDIKVHSPNELSFTAFERHGNTPNKSSVWKFTSKSPQDFSQGADKGYSTSTGGRYVSKSDKFIQDSNWSRDKSLEDDEKTVWGIPELVQYRRHYGLQGRSSSLIKTSSDGKTRLVHYGVQSGLNNIDPSHMGSGLGAQGLESKYGRPEVERSYFYREGSDPERVVTARSKARYTAELEPHHSIYDIGTDPDGIFMKLKNSGKTVNKGIVTSDEYLQAVKDAGHYGFHNSKSSLAHAVALFYKHPVKEDKDFDKQSLYKSKNVREQRRKVFGTAHQPAKNSHQRAKQLAHIKEQFQRRYNVPAGVTEGKKNAAGKWIDKPDWKVGVLNYQDNVDAAIHEGAHFEQMPEGVTMEQHQVDMDRQFGEANRDYGYMQQKRTQGEIQPQAAENPIRRRLGLPANTTEVLVTPKTTFPHKGNPERGRRPNKDDEVPLSVDTKTPMAVRGKKGGKDVFLRRQSRLLSDENRERMQRIDSGEIVYDKDRGWVESTSINAKINQKARMGAEAYFKWKLNEIRAKQKIKEVKEEIEEPLASSLDEKLKGLKHKIYGSRETEKQAFERRIKEYKANARAKENNPQKDPMKINAKIAARDMKKTDEPKSLDYSKINQIAPKEPAPKTLNYAEMKKPDSTPKTLNYAEMKKPSLPSATKYFRSKLKIP